MLRPVPRELKLLQRHWVTTRRLSLWGTRARERIRSRTFQVCTSLWLNIGCQHFYLLQFQQCLYKLQTSIKTCQELDLMRSKPIFFWNFRRLVVLIMLIAAGSRMDPIILVLRLPCVVSTAFCLLSVCVCDGVRLKGIMRIYVQSLNNSILSSWMGIWLRAFFCLCPKQFQVKRKQYHGSGGNGTYQRVAAECIDIVATVSDIAELITCSTIAVVYFPQVSAKIPFCKQNEQSQSNLLKLSSLDFGFTHVLIEYQ